MTQKILSHPLSLSSPAITFRTSERPWCRTFARPLLLNHTADSPPEPTAAVIASPAIIAAPSREESGVFVPSSHHGGPNASRQPPAAPCTLSTGCLSSCFSLTNRGRPPAARFPSIRWVDSLVCTAEVQRPRQTPRQLSAPLIEAAIASVSPHHHGTSTQQSTVRLFVSNSLFLCCICVLFWFDLFDCVLMCWCWFAAWGWVRSSLLMLVLGLGLMLVFFAVPGNVGYCIRLIMF